MDILVLILWRHRAPQPLIQGAIFNFRAPMAPGALLGKPLYILIHQIKKKPITFLVCTTIHLSSHHRNPQRIHSSGLFGESWRFRESPYKLGNPVTPLGIPLRRPIIWVDPGWIGFRGFPGFPTCEDPDLLHNDPMQIRGSLVNPGSCIGLSGVKKMVSLFGYGAMPVYLID